MKILSVTDEDFERNWWRFCRNASCALNKIPTFVFTFKLPSGCVQSLFCLFYKCTEHGTLNKGRYKGWIVSWYSLEWAIINQSTIYLLGDTTELIFVPGLWHITYMKHSFKFYQLDKFCIWYNQKRIVTYANHGHYNVLFLYTGVFLGNPSLEKRIIHAVLYL